MDLSLSESQIKLIREVRELVNQQVKPCVQQKDFSLSSDLDWQLIRKIGEYNLICPTIPKEYGGLGLDMFTTVLVMEEIAASCRGLSAIIAANIHAAQPIILAGSSEQKEMFLPRLTGENACLAAFALTEQTGGSDINSMNTFATKDSESFIINGRKDYILNACEAEIIALFAMTDRPSKRSSIRCFIIPKNTPGVKIGCRRDIAALNYARLAEIIFENAKVDSNLVIKPEKPYSGYLIMFQTLDIGRVLTGATSVGMARAAYELANNFANERIQNGKKIKRYQAVSHALVDMATKIEMARLLTWKAAWLIDKGDDYTITSAMAKLSSSIIAQEVIGMAADILAVRAFETGSLMEQLLRDAKVQSTISGTNFIQRNIIASLL